MSFMFFSGRFRRSPVPAVFLAASLIWAMPGNASADQAQAPGTSPAAAAIQAAPPVHDGRVRAEGGISGPGQGP